MKFEKVKIISCGAAVAFSLVLAGFSGAAAETPEKRVLQQESPLEALSFEVWATETSRKAGRGSTPGGRKSSERKGEA